VSTAGFYHKEVCPNNIYSLKSAYMQTLLEVLKNLWGKPWFSEILLILFFASVFLWQMSSGTVKVLQRKIKSKPNDYDAHYQLGDILAEDEMYEEAEGEFRHAIDLNPQDIKAYRSLFWLLDETNRLADAEEIIKRVIVLFPQDGIAYTYLGINLEKQGKTIEAEDAFKKALSLAPNSSYTHIYYGRFLGEQKRLDEAQNEFQFAIKIDPTEITGHLNLARVYKSSTRNQDAEDIYRKLISHYPHDERAYSEFWELLKNNNRISDAELFFKQASSKNRKDIFIKQLVALSLWGQDKFEELEIYVEKLVKLQPDNVYNLLAYGHTLDKLNKDSLAKKICQQAVGKFPHESEAHFFLGQILEKSKEYKEAVACFKRACEIEPENKGFFEYLINFLRKTKNYHDALEHLSMFLKNNPEDFIALMTIASIKKSMGDIRETEEYIEKARAYIPKNENYWYNIACLEAILGNNTTSFKNLIQAKDENHLDKEWAWEDPDLQWIRDDPRFVEIVGPKPEK
jgi:tetratricopeptide (TPR) repeat protein